MYERLCVIIPCYNEADCIAGVLRDLAASLPGATLVVVNDHSDDASAREAAATGLAEVLSLPVHLGIGGAVQTGMKFAVVHHYEYAVKFDGDGQHQAAEVERLLQPIRNGEAEVAIGSRFLAGVTPHFHSPLLRRAGMAVFRIVNSLLAGQRITDNTSGFRAYNRRALEFLAEHYPAFDYPEPEEIVLLAHNRFRLREVGTAMAARTTGVSSITGWTSIYYMIKVLIAILMVAVRPAITERQTL